MKATRTTRAWSAAVLSTSAGTPSGYTSRRPASLLGLAKTSSTAPVSARRPRSRIATREQISSITFISWVITTTVMPMRRLMS